MRCIESFVDLFLSLFNKLTPIFIAFLFYTSIEIGLVANNLLEKHRNLLSYWTFVQSFFLGVVILNLLFALLFIFNVGSSENIILLFFATTFVILGKRFYSFKSYPNFSDLKIYFSKIYSKYIKLTAFPTFLAFGFAIAFFVFYFSYILLPNLESDSITNYITNTRLYLSYGSFVPTGNWIGTVNRNQVLMGSYAESLNMSEVSQIINLVSLLLVLIAYLKFYSGKFITSLIRR